MHEEFHEENKISIPFLQIKSVDLEDVQADQYNDPWKSQNRASDLSIKQEFISPIFQNEDKFVENMTSPIGFVKDLEPSVDLERDVVSNKNQSSSVLIKELTSPEPKVSSRHLDRDLVPNASHHLSTYTTHQGFSNGMPHK
mgnify:CR=1 FL=1